MKFIFALLMMSEPSLAADCPQLAGEYTCTDEKGESSQLRMTQWLENEVHVYSDRTDDYYADGEPRPLNWGFFTGTGVATCPLGTLNIIVEGEVFLDGGKFADIKNDSQYQMQDADVLLINEKYERWRTNGQYELILDKFVCKRN